jgi:hypothetical protein
MILGVNKKQYIGAIADEEVAARLYDWHVIIS